MSAISVDQSPRPWVLHSPRRKPAATATIPPATAAATAATLTALYSGSSRSANPANRAVNADTTVNNRGSKPAKTFLLERDISAVASSHNNNNNNNNNVSGNDNMDVGGCGGGGGGGVSRISFAPGTTFNDRSRLRSRGSSRQFTIPDAINIRPGTSEAAQRRFKLPKATLPSLHYLSVSQEDFLDPRYAEDIVKTYGIPKYFFKSKSNLLTNCQPAPAKPRRKLTATTNLGDGPSNAGDGAVAQTGHDQKVSEVGKQHPQRSGKDEASVRMKREAEDARPTTSGAAIPRISQRLPIVVPIATTSPDQRHPSVLAPNNSSAEGGVGGAGADGNGAGSLPHVLPLYKPLIGEKYTQARFCPPMNPFRSLQMESEVTKYVDHKKRVGLGKYVRHAETDSHPPSALAREASMYDLNNQGPVERPLDQYLPPPERKPFLRHRPREPKNDTVRPSDDRDLVIMPRETTATERSSVILKEMLR